MAKNLLDWLKSQTLDRTNLDEKVVGAVKSGVNKLQNWQAGNRQAAQQATLPQPYKIANDFAVNRVIEPFKAVPKNLDIATNPFLPKSERFMGGLMAAGGLSPGIEDLGFAGYDFAKAKAAKKTEPWKSFTGQEYTGLGEATSRGKGGTAANLLNYAELPALLALGGLKAKGGIGSTRMAQNAVDASRRMDIPKARNFQPAPSRLKKAENFRIKVEGKPAQVLSGQDFADWTKYYDSKGIKYDYNKLGNQGGFMSIGKTEKPPKIAPENVNPGQKVIRIRSDAPRKMFVKVAKEARKTGARIELTPSKAGTVVPEGLKITDSQKPLMLEDGSLKINADISTIPETNKAQGLFRKTFLDTSDNLRKTLGEPFYKQYAEPLLDKLSTRIAQSVDWGNKQRIELATLVKESGIKPGGEEDKLIRLLNKPDGEAKLIEKVGVDRAGQIKGVYEAIRTKYQQYFELTNAARAQAGLKPLPFKEDFLSQIGGKKGNIKGSGPFTTDEYSAGIFKKQEGKATTGAIESMVTYIDKIERAAFSDASAVEFKALREALTKQKGVPKTALDALEMVQKNVSGAGKTVGGPMATFESYMGKIKGAAVAGKASTLINQTLSLPHAIANAGPINFVKGFGTDASSAMKQSEFIRAAWKKTPSALRGTPYEKYTGSLGDVLQEANNMVYESAWKGLYSKAKQLGAPDAVKWADKESARILGDRRLGMTPEVYNTLVGKIIGAFTIEPTAMATSFFQNIARKKVGTVLGTIVAWKIGNELNENFGTGSAMLPDPIDAIMDAKDLWTGTDEKEQSKIQAVARIFAEMIQMAPIVQSGVYTAYSLGESAKLLPDSREVFGKEDPTWMNTGSLLNPLTKWDRNITGNKLVDAPLNVASKYVPGLEQVLKTGQAGISLARGYAETKDGDPMYQMPKDIMGAGQALVMGQSSTKQARDFFDKTNPGWLSDSQKNYFDTIGTKEGKLAFLDKVQPENSRVQDISSRTIKIKDGKPVGGGSVDMSGASVREKEAKRELISTSIKYGEPVDPKDLEFYYMDEINSMPSKTAYEARKKEEASYTSAGKIYDSESLAPEQKTALYKKLGTSEEEVDYAKKAGDNDTDQTLYIQDQLASMNSDERLQYLLRGRSIVNNGMLISDSVLGKLVTSGDISKSESSALKSVSFVKDNSYTGTDGVKIGDNIYKPVKKAGSGSGAKGFGTDSMVKIKMPATVSGKSGSSSKGTLKLTAPATKKLTISKPNLQKRSIRRKIKLKY